MRHKYDVLRRHCDAIGRDPADIHVSTQAMVFMSDDEKYLKDMRARDVGRVAIVGTPAEIVDVMGDYAKANVDEYVLVDFSVGRLDRKLELLERFAKDVAAHAK
jgi:alkanesulfonate monooxygenase SsuD/methylene tetrahydromethanopterin reductase-like flavin-dependent oxidoreductase (luciferase family)